MIINSNRCVGLAVGFCVLLSAATADAAQDQACFVPPLPGGCDPLTMVVQTINGAQKAIRVQMYEFTSTDIRTALANAKLQNVDVQAIVDKSQEHAPLIVCLAASGVTVLVDDKVPGLMHNKVMIVDEATVVTGSFNYTSSAEHKNAENLLLIHDPGLVAAYTQYWNVRAGQSRPLSVALECKVADGPVRGNRHSKIYHWPTCRDYDTVAPQHRVEFPSAKDAEAEGYRPSQSCR
jgi:phosphatidylserine/phosphatidylglycerophosphate/cardiolipin synthase-like enzyme